MEFSLEFKKAIFEEERRLQVEIEVAQSRLKALEAIKQLWQNGNVVLVNEFLRIAGTVIEDATPMPQLPIPAPATANLPGNENAMKTFMYWYEEVKKWMKANLAEDVEYQNAIVKKQFPLIKPYDVSTILNRLSNDKIISRKSHSREFIYGKKKVKSVLVSKPIEIKEEAPELSDDDITDILLPISEPSQDEDEDEDEIEDTGAIGLADAVMHQRFKTAYKPEPFKGKLNKTKFVETIGRHLIRKRINRTVVKSPETFWILFNSDGRACEELLAGTNKDWEIS